MILIDAGNASSSDGNESGGSSSADFPSEGRTQTIKWLQFQMIK